MARELSGSSRQLTRVEIRGIDAAPSTCDASYSVIITDGMNDDLFEESKTHNEESPNFNQTVTALCSGIIGAIKTDESIA